DNYTFLPLKDKITDKEIQNITAIAPANENKIWLYTKTGLASYDPRLGTVQPYLLPEEFSGHTIEVMRQSHEGDLYLGFKNFGLGILRSNGDFEHYVHDDEKFHSIHNNKINCILEDQFDHIWFGTTTGISKIAKDKRGIVLIQNKSGLDQVANNVGRVHKDRQGRIWMDTESGLYSKNLSDQAGLKSDFGLGPQEIVRTETFYEDKYGHLWIAALDKGIWKKLKHKTYFEKVYIDHVIDQAIIYKIMKDSHDDETIWVGTDLGLMKLNNISFKHKIYSPKTQLPEVSSNKTILFAQYGDEIWMYYTFYNSIGKFNKISSTFEIVRPPASQQYMLEGIFRDMIVSKEGLLWIATNFGLVRYDIGNNKFEIFTKRHGLIGNDLNAVVIDKKGRLWVCGQKFISTYDPTKNRFISYDVSEEVKKFWVRAGHLAWDGQLCFGSLNGAFCFYPDSIKWNTTSPNIVLTDFKVRGVSILLDEAYEYVKNIQLSYDQNDIAFEFSGIHYDDPSTWKYSCWLEGYDETWRDLGNDHHVVYTNLNPDHYKFRLKSSNRDGTWHEKELNIDVTITPPYTQTWWFRLLITIMGLTILFFIAKNRRNHMVLKSQ
ncbi:MAG: two-component regulator propeller domain-containing protein, partial [Saprospiraceae bacterium]